MYKKIRQFLHKLWKDFSDRSMYVIIDPRDNSITFSKRLFKSMRLFDKEEANAFVFRVGNNYAFTINPPITADTQLCSIQYNSKHKCIGFESLCPTVNKICYDYGLPYDKPIKLTIEVKTTEINTLTYYILMPNDNTAR